MRMFLSTLMSGPDLSFPASISSRKLSTILIVILGPKSDTNKAWQLRDNYFNSTLFSLRKFLEETSNIYYLFSKGKKVKPLPVHRALCLCQRGSSKVVARQ